MFEIMPLGKYGNYFLDDLICYFISLVLCFVFFYIILVVAMYKKNKLFYIFS